MNFFEIRSVRGGLSPVPYVFVLLLFLLSSCKEEESVVFDFEQTPVQTVRDMKILQSDQGRAEMRMEAPLMQRFSFTKDSVDQSYEYYPEGFSVSAYTEQGELETTITSNQAKHITTAGQESWSAFGDVVVINHIKGEKMESDTIYWNREEKKIYTDCYVRLSSESGLMQGYGMTSDERARDAVILRPFNTYAVEHDSTYFFVDTINTVGPQPKK